MGIVAFRILSPLLSPDQYKNIGFSRRWATLGR